MIKYSVQYSSYDNSKWEINIGSDNYSGSKIAVYGSGKESAILNYQSDSDNPFSVIYRSTLTINLIQQGQIDINELQQVQDREWNVDLYRNGVIYWKGFLITDGIQYPLAKKRHKVTLTAVCGLSLLDKMDYIHADLIGGRTPINYFRQILYGNLGIFLPIKWNNNLQCTAYIGQDVFAGSVEWATDNQGFYSYQSGQNGDKQGSIKSCLYILEGMLKANQCRIFQANGEWVIRRIPEYIGSSVLTKIIQPTLGLINLTDYVENVKKRIGLTGYPLINEDQIIITKPGIKSVRVTYDANVRENILPNGNQDITQGNGFVNWGINGTNASVQIGNSLDGRSGHAALLLATHPSLSDFYTLKAPLGTFTNDGLPIDTETMVKYINFSFLFSPTNGFPQNPDGTINWDTNPFKIKVIFNSGADKYFLNDFGFWVLVDTEISVTIPGLKYNEVARINFDKFRNIIMPLPATPPVAGDISDIVVMFKIQPGQQYRLDNISISLDDGNEVFESTYSASKNTEVEDVSLNISSSFGGYNLSNFMTNWSKSDDECYYRDGIFYENTLTGMTANVMMRSLYKSSKIFNGSINVREQNWSFDEVYLIDPFGSSTFIMLSNTSYNTEKSEVSVVAIECRNDNVIFTEKYYNSNDYPTSN